MQHFCVIGKLAVSSTQHLTALHMEPFDLASRRSTRASELSLAAHDMSGGCLQHIMSDRLSRTKLICWQSGPFVVLFILLQQCTAAKLDQSFSAERQNPCQSDIHTKVRQWCLQPPAMRQRKLFKTLPATTHMPAMDPSPAKPGYWRQCSHASSEMLLHQWQSIQRSFTLP